MKKLALAISLFALVGCYHDKKSSAPEPHLDPFGHEEIMMQIICCAPGYMKPSNADKCSALKPLQPPNDTMDFGGIRTSMVTDAAACVNLDETPFWGSPN